MLHPGAHKSDPQLWVNTAPLPNRLLGKRRRLKRTTLTETWIGAQHTVVVKYKSQHDAKCTGFTFPLEFTKKAETDVLETELPRTSVVNVQAYYAEMTL